MNSRCAMLLLVLLVIEPAQSTSHAATSSTLVASSAADLRLSAGAAITANPLSSLRSGEPHQHSVAVFDVPLTSGISIDSVAFQYRYTTGFGPSGKGSNFSVFVAGTPVYRSPQLTAYTYSKSHPNYSSPISTIARGLGLRITDAVSHVSLVFDNNDRNVQLLLPLRVTVSCTDGPCVAYPLLPTFIDSNMVLQRAPALPSIWGHNAAPGEAITVQLDRGASWSTTANSTGHWNVRLAPQAASTGHTLTLDFSTSKSRRRVLTNIAFGDVYLCSGQSNMEFSLNHAFNASAEIADSDRYPNLRMFTAAHAVSDSPQFNVADKTGGAGPYANSSWAVSSAEAFAPVGQRDFSWFSAVCYFFGRDVYKELGGTVPIGLIASDWGGQAIQVFSSPDALNDTSCGGTVGQYDDDTAVFNDMSTKDGTRLNPTASQLWFGMLAPFTPMRFAGVVWYQGEDNCWAPHEYSCLFPAMISDWRTKFSLPNMSFLFVQLAPYWPRRDFTAVRNAQMAALKLPKTGYAVAIDLGDVHSPVTPIHPRRKQEVGRRLALSALSVQYGRNVVSTGPVFASIRSNPAANTAVVSYVNGTASSLHSAGTADCELVGSKRCCGESPFEVRLLSGQWQRVNYTLQEGQAVLSLAFPAGGNRSPSVAGALAATTRPRYMVASPLSVRYAWEAWPQCSLYNGEGGPDNHTGIAATPFCWNGTVGRQCDY